MDFERYIVLMNTEWMFVFAIICFLFGGFIFKITSNYCRRFKIKKKFNRGKQGEKEAYYFLESHGYKILAEQVEEDGLVEIDGVEHVVQLKVDFLVEKKGAVSIVEVKTGDKATSALYSATRRQLLEYAINYPCDEVLLYDADRKKLQKINFKVKSYSINKMKFLTHAAYILIIVVIFLYFMKQKFNLTYLLESF